MTIGCCRWVEQSADCIIQPPEPLALRRRTFTPTCHVRPSGLAPKGGRRLATYEFPSLLLRSLLVEPHQAARIVVAAGTARCRGHTCNAGALTLQRFSARRKCGEHGAHGEFGMLLAEPLTDRVIGLAIELRRHTALLRGHRVLRTSSVLRKPGRGSHRPWPGERCQARAVAATACATRAKAIALGLCGSPVAGDRLARWEAFHENAVPGPALPWNDSDGGGQNSAGRRTLRPQG